MASSSAFASLFNEDEFRTNIRATMQMGMPEDEADRLTWVWKRERTYERPSRAGRPFDLGSAPVTDVATNDELDDDGGEQTLIVDYALEFSSRPAGSQTTMLGEIDTSRAEVTLFDVDWEQVRTADYCQISDAKYRIQFAGPPIALFAVGVITIYLEAVDEA